MTPEPATHRRVVVDGSNIATEGRAVPSLAQLDEAIRAFLEEFRGFRTSDVTVVVDATFGHRIDPSEVPAFEEAVAHGEMVTPPAGAIGRGDAFILRVAEKAGALVLSNDSFQEFHAERPWLFDEGRLIGGKPVPGIGWIFTPRTPVRGATSRAVTKKAKGTRSAAASNGDDGVPVAAPPEDDAAPGGAPRAGRRSRGGRGTRSRAGADGTGASAAPDSRAAEPTTAAASKATKAATSTTPTM
ncbi:MAG: NYN domain-containing protein, partial [Acidimicrobiales bacterium]